MKRYLNEDYRTDLMDEAEELYTPDTAAEFEDAFQTVMEISINDVDDSDPDEGFWSICTNEDIKNIIELAKQYIYGEEGASKNTYEFTNEQISLIARAMEMWSDPSFSRDRQESAVAKEIVRYLNKY